MIFPPQPQPSTLQCPETPSLIADSSTSPILSAHSAPHAKQPRQPDTPTPKSSRQPPPPTRTTTRPPATTNTTRDPPAPRAGGSPQGSPEPTQGPTPPARHAKRRVGTGGVSER